MDYRTFRTKKKIRFHLLILAALRLSAACMKFDFPSRYPAPTEREASVRFVPYETLYINVPEGYKSVIYIGSTKVATCYKSGNIILPKSIGTKAELPYEVINVAVDSESRILSENTLEMVVAYEDTKNGDHDYNDLVFQAHLDILNGTDGSSTIKMEITPVAMGASIKLGLGCVLTGADGAVFADELISADCRSYLFNGDQGFINTMFSRKHYAPCTRTITPAVTGAVTDISWYLISNDQRLYASTSFQACLDSENMPQGLVLMNLRPDIFYKEEGGAKYYCGNDFWQYPMESVPISEVYPAFTQSFLDKGDFSCLAEPEGRFFDAIAADENGLLCEDCLYTAYKQSGDPSVPTVQGIQLWEGGPLWADRNVGAKNSLDPGLFFSWGNVDGHHLEDIGYGEGYYQFASAAYWNSTTGGALTEPYTSGDPQYDAARYISKTDPTKWIFIPGAGVVDEGTRKAFTGNNPSYAQGAGIGYCWLSSITQLGDPLNVTSGSVISAGPYNGNPSGYTRSVGMPIRAICDCE